MFGILVYDILFFTIPVLLLAFLGVSIYLYASAKAKNRKIPGSFSSGQLRLRLIFLIVAAVLTGFFAAVVIGFVALLYLAVAFM